MPRILFILLSVYYLSACASLMNSATQKMADNLSLAMLKQNDLETVKAGAPAYLIMIDSLIEGDPRNTDLLITASKLYASYTSAFVDDEQRAKRLAQKSLEFAHNALCLDIPQLCDKMDMRVDDFSVAVKQVNKSQQAVFYAYASAWAGWVQVNTDDWNAIAQIPKLSLMFKHSLELDETFDRGGAHLYLGVLSSQIPPSLGGKPEQGRFHFEKAQSLSESKNLMVNVLFAENYARLLFEQELHDELLRQVLNSTVDEPELTLINTLARTRAARLLAESSDFF